MLIELRFYTTAGCHLCEEALLMLLEAGRRLPLAVEEIDIADSDELLARFGLRIPVIVRTDDGRELGWPFTGDSLLEFLEDRRI